ncbi:MAG: SseB family protein [Aliishimia sp.]
MTELDTAHQSMEASDAGRLQFYATLADAELFMLLEKEPEGEDIEPQLFPVEGQDFVLVFDTLERMAEFTSKPVPYVALPGRIVAQLLAEQGIGLGLNLDVAPSAMLLPPDALSWLVDTLGGDGPDQTEAQIVEFLPPRGVPETLLMGLAERLSKAGKIAQAALLVQVRYADETTGFLLALVGAEVRAEPALARAASEAVTFSGIDAGFLDVGFFAQDDPSVVKMKRVAFEFELPEPEAPQEMQIPGYGPGLDPKKPPRLN